MCNRNPLLQLVDPEPALSAWDIRNGDGRLARTETATGEKLMGMSPRIAYDERSSPRPSYGCHMRLPISSLLLTQALLVAPGFGQRLDHYGDPLPPGAVVRLGTKRFQTKGGFGWTPDGKSLATLRGGTVYFWDLEDGHCRETLLVPINPDPFFSYGATLVLSQDGQRLICADFHGGVATWNLATVESSSLPAPNKQSREESRAVALHPDGKQFVTLRQNGELQFRDFATCQVQRTILTGKRWYEGSTAAFSPDGNTLALGGGGGKAAIYLLDLRKKADPDIISTTEGERLHGLNFMPDGRLYSFDSSRLLIWDLSKQPPMSRVFPLPADVPADYSATFSADGKILVTLASDRILIWDVEAEKIVRTIDGLHIRNASRAIVKIDPLGKYVAVDDRQSYVRIWELATGKRVLSTDQQHQRAIFSADWLPGGTRIATGDWAGEVRVWDDVTGKPLLDFRGPEFGVFALRYLPDGRQIVLCGHEVEANLSKPNGGGIMSGPVRWHDGASGRLLRQAQVPVSARLLSPSPDWSQIAVATLAESGKASIHLLDGMSGKENGRFDIDAGGWQVNALVWSTDGKSLFTATSSKVTQTDPKTQKPIAEAALPHMRQDRITKMFMESGFYRAAFLRNGAEIITAGELPEFYGWKLPAGERQWVVGTDGEEIRLLAPAPNERMLAVVSMSADSRLKLRLLELPSRRLLSSFDLGSEKAEVAVFSPDRSRLLVGLGDGTALVYDVSDAWDTVE